ncbi:MAG TPA: hypothetical protein VLF68_04675 [Candidatus Saccharimonadales bacterium]|nr:hypothetical protein [Candidatus Saccharimonadales bacterium]
MAGKDLEPVFGTRISIDLNGKREDYLLTNRGEKGFGPFRRTLFTAQQVDWVQEEMLRYSNGERRTILAKEGFSTSGRYRDVDDAAEGLTRKIIRGAERRQLTIFREEMDGLRRSIESRNERGRHPER